MLCPPQPPEPWVADWVERHRHPASLVLHMLGIPPTVLGVMLIPVYLWQWSLNVFLVSLTLFVGGYALQFLGHALDGSEPGEVTGVRRLASRALARIHRPRTEGVEVGRTPAPAQATRG